VKVVFEESDIVEIMSECARLQEIGRALGVDRWTVQCEGDDDGNPRVEFWPAAPSS